jgi:hypothetical protein
MHSFCATGVSIGLANSDLDSSVKEKDGYSLLHGNILLKDFIFVSQYVAVVGL